MILEEFVSKGWADHPTDAAGVMARLPEGIGLVEKPEDLPRLADLIVHVTGEHMGSWSAGIDLLGRLESLPVFDPAAVEGKSIARAKAVLHLGAGHERESEHCALAARTGGNVPEASDRIRILAVATSALNGQKQTDRAAALFDKALSLASYLTAGAPASATERTSNTRPGKAATGGKVTGGSNSGPSATRPSGSAPSASAPSASGPSASAPPPSTPPASDLPTHPPTPDPAARALAVAGNNLAVSLEERDSLSDTEKGLMLRAAAAARRFWEIAGTWMNVERAEYRLAMGHIKAGEARAALGHAAECLRVVQDNGSDPVELFFAHEAMSRARLAAGDRPGALEARGLADALLASITDDSMRSYCAGELAKLTSAIGPAR